MIYYIIGGIILLSLIAPAIMLLNYRRYIRKENARIQKKLNESTRELLNRV